MQDDRDSVLDQLTVTEAEALLYDQTFWLRDKQLPPPGDWSVWLIRSGRGFGKALALDTPIPTRMGWTTMGAIVPGEQVFDELGTLCTVVEVHPVTFNEPCVRVSFSDGTEVVCDRDHLWNTIDARGRKRARESKSAQWNFAETRSAHAIQQTLMHQQRERNHCIPCCAPLQLPEQEFTIHPYVLGAWLGDGASRDASIYKPDVELFEEIERCGETTTIRNTRDGECSARGIGVTDRLRDSVSGRFATDPNSFYARLKALDLIGNKHVPLQYLRGSQTQRLALLQGLMDTDGYCSQGGYVEFCSTTENLARGVHELAVSLGMKPTISEGRATLKGVDYGPAWSVCWTPYEKVFRLPRKRDRQKLPGAQASRQSRRYIVAVENVTSVPVRCITVDSASELYLCGRGMVPTHNTRSGSNFVHQRAMQQPGRWIAMIAKTPADARDYMIEGPGGILKNTRPNERPHYEPSKRRLTWPNGSWATIYSDEEPDQLRGFSGDTAWLDEFAKFRYAKEVWDNLQFGMRERSNDRPRILISTTPRPIKILNDIAKDRSTVVIDGSSYENRDNLDPSWFANLAKYEGTRFGRQEIHGEVLEDVSGALWTRDSIERLRVAESDKPTMRRIIVAIDPSASSDEDSDEAGVVVCGLGQDGEGYVLADASGRMSPTQWAQKAIQLYEEFEADLIVGEVNNGGEMIETTLRVLKPGVAYKAITASRGKVLRAEPVSTLYERSLVHHVGAFPALEDQMCAFTLDWNRVSAGYSPDRVDALVYALTELMLGSAEQWIAFFGAMAKASQQAQIDSNVTPIRRGENKQPELPQNRVTEAYNKVAGPAAQAKQKCAWCGEDLGSSVATDGEDKYHNDHNLDCYRLMLRNGRKVSA